MTDRNREFLIDDLPGTSKPPHHRQFGDQNPEHVAKDRSESPTKPKSMASTSGSPSHKVNQWTLDMPEDTRSSRTDDPRQAKSRKSELERKQKKGISAAEESQPQQQFEMTPPVTSLPHVSKYDESIPPSVPRAPRYDRYKSYDDMLDDIHTADPFHGEYQPSDKPRLSKIPKRKKHKKHSSRNRLREEGDDVPSTELEENKDTTDEPDVRKMKKKKWQPASESVTSTTTYTVDKGADKPESRKNSGVKGQDTQSIKSTGTYTLQSSDNDVEVSFGESFRTALNKKLKRIDTVRIPSRDLPQRNGLNESKTADFISQHIIQRECNRYARDGKSRSNACQCGREIHWHVEKGLKCPLDSDHDFWHQKTHSETMECDSFGEIYFRGFGHDTRNSPYVRLDDHTDLETVWTILTKYWHLPIPKLLISITGGAKRFQIKPRLKDILKQGLCHAASSTGAWIITGGTGTGIMQIVGEAVHEHAMAHGIQDSKVVALGIASWGIVSNRFALDGEGDKGLFPATYAVEDIQTESRGAPLDHNHSHFILVDNGTENIYGGEIRFRTALESYISKKVETGVAQNQSVHVPNVLLVVEGGVNTMVTVRESVQHQTPVVVIEGTGKAADFISLGFKLSKPMKTDAEKTEYPSEFDDIMKVNARKIFVWDKQTSDETERKIHDCLRSLKEMLKHRRMINIFNLDTAYSNKDIDRAILYALLKANKSNANSQLALALAWNRCDIAREEIFSIENRQYWKQIDLYGAMFTALVENRVDFVQLFIDNGVDFKKFLTIHTLWNLYCNAISDKSDTQAELFRFLINYLKQTWLMYLTCQSRSNCETFPDLLRYVSKVIVHLLKDEALDLYSDEKFIVHDKSGPTKCWEGNRDNLEPLMKRISKRESAIDGNTTSRRAKRKFKDVVDFENPEQDLFIWAILFNHKKLAGFFWRLGKDQLGSGLIASALLKALSRVANDEEELELSADLEEHAQMFENHCTELMSECYRQDKRMSHQLLVRELPTWGNMTLFSIADAHNMMDFMEHSSCQTKLNFIWKGQMALYTSELKILLCLFFPIALPFIKFASNTKVMDIIDGDEDDDDDDVNIPVNSERSTIGKNRVMPNCGENEVEFTPSRSLKVEKIPKKKLFKVNMFDFNKNSINIISAILYFYSAPITKFFFNLLSYLVFLAIFSYFILVDLRPVEEVDSPSIWEIITWIWIATMMIEEIRQVFIRDELSIKYKIQNWFSNMWNQFDLLMYSMLVLCIILRFNLFTSNFIWCRMMYSLTLTMFYLRSMQFFFAEKNMGPKVIMIHKMITDLMFFFLILLVFVVSFGVAYHVNMFPNSPMSWLILKEVLLMPYLQMYGELFLEKIEGEDIPGCTRNRSIWLEVPSMRCPESNGLSTILLAVYMLLTNILLVNLLIAMFSYTFQTVQDKSLKVWRFYRLSLIFEYYDRPTLVPPIIIINHIYRLIRCCIVHTCHKCKRHNSFREVHSARDNDRLSFFEKMATENYLSHSDLLERQKLDTRVSRTAERIENVMHELALIKETVLAKERQQSNDDDDGLIKPVKVVQLSQASVTNSSSSGETAFLRQCVDDLSEQASQQTLKMSQIMHMLEMVVKQKQSPRHEGHKIHNVTKDDHEA